MTTSEVVYTNARLSIDETRTLALTVESVAKRIDWDSDASVDLVTKDLAAKGAGEASYSECPAELMNPKNFTAWEKNLRRWLRTDNPLVLFKSPCL